MNFRFSQGSVATQLRWGGKCYHSYSESFLENLSVKEFWKSVKYSQKLWPKNKVAVFFGTLCISTSVMHLGQPQPEFANPPESGAVWKRSNVSFHGSVWHVPDVDVFGLVNPSPVGRSSSTDWLLVGCGRVEQSIGCVCLCVYARAITFKKRNDLCPRCLALWSNLTLSRSYS